MQTETRAPAGEDVLLRVRGTVQGVGFRPFVSRNASRLRLRGWVRNDPQGVLIRAVGPRPAIDALIDAIRSDPPPAAKVETVEASASDPGGPAPDRGFSIVPSLNEGGSANAGVSPDLAVCAECLGEMLDRGDRRHGYPFINCTQCGPRYSILERLPYDRPHTTMRAFRMCPACRAEYGDPESRRFHAQPNACPQCGPAAAYVPARGERASGGPAIAQAAALLATGGILAVKGIGGYHLMVDASNAAAVSELRRRKGREDKPFAVMFRDLDEVRAAAVVPAGAEELLASPAAPIVLLVRREDARLAPGIAVGNPWVGALLPYAPLQVLLLAAFRGPVVATSANLSEEPLCHTRDDARLRLAGIADGYLEHDRGIAHPVDDSVLRIAGTGPIRLRRARGYAPSPLRLPGALEGSWLCAGAQMKSVLAVASGDRVVLSPHIGDLDGAATREAYRRTAEMLSGLHGAAFTAVACDRHPDYASSRYAAGLGLPCVRVQHHLAHVLACLLENNRRPEGILGVAWDGTGYGEDGTVWGGEFILLAGGRASRFASLRPFRLPGGEAAVRDGRRSALALVHATGNPRYGEIARSLGMESLASPLRHLLSTGLNSPVTTSAGRLFDAAGALLGLGGVNRFEGQVPLALEAAAMVAGAAGTREMTLDLRKVERGAGAACELDWEPLLESILLGRSRGEDPANLAAAFHQALAAGIAAVARAAGVGTVALSGGCFQNALLLDLTVAALKADGFQVLVHRELPPNDGNIAAGQALGALLGLTSVDFV